MKLLHTETYIHSPILILSYLHMCGQMALGQTLHLDYDCRFQEYRLYAGVLIDATLTAVMQATLTPAQRYKKTFHSKRVYVATGLKAKGSDDGEVQAPPTPTPCRASRRFRTLPSMRWNSGSSCHRGSRGVPSLRATLGLAFSLGVFLCSLVSANFRSVCVFSL